MTLNCVQQYLVKIKVYKIPLGFTGSVLCFLKAYASLSVVKCKSLYLANLLFPISLKLNNMFALLLA